MATIVVDILAVLFGISSWVDINGLWAELPLLVRELPESWNLASYIVVTSQLANLGPILFTVLRRFFSQKTLEVPAIHSTLAVGVASCLLLVFFWNSTTYVAGGYHSTALLTLAFALAFVDCTSSVLYLPFMANFRERFVLPYLIGEGMSGLVPSIVALAQGAGGNPECRNITDNSTESGYKIEAYNPPPRFSVNVFFGILTILVVISWVAFHLLNVLPIAKLERVSNFPVTNSPPKTGDSFMASGSQNFVSSTDGVSTEKSGTSLRDLMPFRRCFFLLTIQTYIALLHNVLLSLQTYSCLPYGNFAYHLAVNLSGMTSPLLCFVAMFVTVKSLSILALLTAFCSAWGAYVLSTAIMSPEPPLVTETSGTALIVISWIVVVGSMAYIKACVATNFRIEGGHVALFWCGVVNQLGSTIGALITFFLLNFADIFHTYQPCR